MFSRSDKLFKSDLSKKKKTILNIFSDLQNPKKQNHIIRNTYTKLYNTNPNLKQNHKIRITNTRLFNTNTNSTTQTQTQTLQHKHKLYNTNTNLSLCLCCRFCNSVLFLPTTVISRFDKLFKSDLYKRYQVQLCFRICKIFWIR